MGSNTATNTATGKPFTKGDPRINRKGRPVNFDALRALSVQIAHEVATGKDKATGESVPVVIDGHKCTVAEMILRQWAKSGDWQRQKGFIEIAFGKVPDKVELTGAEGGPIEYARLTDAELDREIVAAARRISNGAEIPLEPPCPPATDPPAG
jgi:hypothetical protein